MPKIYLPQAFVNDVDLPLAAGLLNMLIRAAVSLDGWSYRRLSCTDALAQRDTIAWNKGHTVGSKRIWYGSLLVQAGMTDLVVSGYANNVGVGVDIEVYLDGSGTPDATITPSSSWSDTIDISAYDEGDIITIDIRTTANDALASEYIVTDVYGTPLSQVLSWPSMPTFAGTYDSARLNALINACSYLFERINLVPMIPTMGTFWGYGTSKVETSPIWAGSVARVHTNDILRIIGQVDIENDSEYIQVLINGSDAYNSSSSPWVKGQHIDFSIPIALSSYASVGGRARVVINSIVTDDGRVNGETIYNSRYTLTVMRNEADSSGWPVYSAPAELAADSAMTSSALDTRLNALSTMLSAIKTRIDANGFMWNRARAFRRRYAQLNQEMNGKLMVQHSPIFQRRGDRLIVRGKNVQVGWGARVIEPQEDDWKQYKYHYDRSETIISGDKTDTVIVPLDTYEGLTFSQLFALTGTTIDYAAEYLF